MKKIYTLLFVFHFSFFIINKSFSQQSACATDEISRSLAESDPVYAAQREELLAGRQQRIQEYLDNRDVQAVRRISVVVHVVYNSSVPAQNVSDNAIATMIQTLNQDFRRQNPDASSTRQIFQGVAADAEIEFCLDQTIRVATSHGCYNESSQTNEMKYANQGGSNAVNPSQFLNIWIVDICGGTNSGTAGYAYLPTLGMAGSSNDGLVLDYSLGMGSGNRTITHEIGHYFNLCHTWGCNGTGCNNDDGFTDTPRSSNANYGTWTNCFDPNVNSCSNENPDHPDQTENYMDYSDCPNMFTIQQAAEMNSILSGIRSGLLNSTGCSSQSGNAPVADFIGTPTSGQPGTTVQFTDQSTNSPTSWSWNFGDPGSGGLNTSTLQNPTHTYNNAGTYTVTLTATNANGSDTRTRTNYITITMGGGGGTTQCDTAWAPFINGTYVIYTAQDGGYVGGNNSYGDKAKAQQYTPVYSPSYINSAIVWFGGKKYTSNNPNSSVIFNIYNANGTGTTTTGTVNTAPGTVIVSGSVPVALIDTTGPMLITFPSTATVSSPYAIGIDFTSMSAGDTVGLVSTQDGDAGITELSWEKWSNNAWYTIKQGWGLAIDFALVPIECNQQPVGIMKEIKADDFFVYPNPSTHIVNVIHESAVSTQAQLRIMDISGKIIYENLVTNRATSIDVSDYSAGIYFAQLQIDGNLKTLKFIVSK